VPIEVIVPILTVLIGILAILQGWSIIQSRRKRNNNPVNVAEKLDIIIAQLGRMEQRLNDIWDKVRTKQ